MKIFAFFMAVLVLALSVMPCADGAAATKGSKTTVVAMKTDNGGETEDDNCSPFCQCACCAGFSISHPVTAIDFSGIHSTTHFSSLVSFDLSGIAVPIWQPPKPILF